MPGNRQYAFSQAVRQTGHAGPPAVAGQAPAARRGAPTIAIWQPDSWKRGAHARSASSAPPPGMSAAAPPGSATRGLRPPPAERRARETRGQHNGPCREGKTRHREGRCLTGAAPRQGRRLPPGRRVGMVHLPRWHDTAETLRRWRQRRHRPAGGGAGSRARGSTCSRTCAPSPGGAPAPARPSSSFRTDAALQRALRGPHHCAAAHRHHPAAFRRGRHL